MVEATDVSLGGETAKALVAKFTLAASGFVATILFARELGPTAFGGYYLLFALTKIADRPLNGWASASKKRFSETTKQRKEVVGAQWGFTVILLLFITSVSFLFREHLITYTGLATAPVLFLLLLATESNYEAFDRVLKARGLISVATWTDAIRSYLTLPLQLLLVIAGFGAAGLAYGLAGATVLTFPILLFYLKVRPTLPSSRTVRSLWEYAKYSIPTEFFATLYSRFDVMLLGLLLTPSAAGQYEVAAMLTLPATFIATLAASGLMPRVSKLTSESKPVAQEISNTLSFASILAVPIFFGALAFPTALVITVYGGEFEAAAPLLVVLAIYRIISTQTTVLRKSINGLDHPSVNMRISAIALSFNIILGIILTIRFGAVGVIIATIFAECLIYISASYFIKQKIHDVTLVSRPLLEQIGAGLIMFVTVSGIHGFIPVQSWVDLSLLLTIGAGTYGVVLLLISDRLRYTIGSILRGSRLEQFVPKPVLRW